MQGETRLWFGGAWACLAVLVALALMALSAGRLYVYATAPLALAIAAMIGGLVGARARLRAGAELDAAQDGAPAALAPQAYRSAPVGAVHPGLDARLERSRATQRAAMRSLQVAFIVVAAIFGLLVIGGLFVLAAVYYAVSKSIGG